MNDRPGDLRLRTPDGALYDLKLTTRPKGWVVSLAATTVGGAPGVPTERVHKDLPSAVVAFYKEAQLLVHRLLKEAEGAKPAPSPRTSVMDVARESLGRALERSLGDHPQPEPRGRPPVRYRIDEQGDLVETVKREET